VSGLLCYKQNTNFPIQTCDTVECPYGPYGEQAAVLMKLTLERWDPSYAWCRLQVQAAPVLCLGASSRPHAQSTLSAELQLPIRQ
jgi:hypothetical protein